MRVIDIENINLSMRDDTRFVLRCEEVFHDKISSAAASILMSKREKPLVCLTGPSGSGKTTTAMRLKAYLENLGVKVKLLMMDNFFLSADQRPPEAQNDWESPYCVDRELLIDSIHRLADGETVEVPTFDFKTGSRAASFTMEGDRDAIIIAEGIHMLNPLIFDRVRDMATGLYVAPRTRIITADDKIVRPEQLRVARRMIRDYNNRGHSLRDTVIRAESVDRGELRYIMPNKPNASIHIDTFHDYEPCILARYLKEIPEFYEQLDDAFIEEHGLTDLIKVVNSVPPLRTDYVPRDSIVREFVGGSSFSY
ncbi:MAG: adenylyl-sulfate kinase [Oscillospiraceae bacterium]|nr:adenylyl-sulfate kinase [Oscillospiraceae bacterium]